MPTRVAVFIDYQNVYRRARAAFGMEYAPFVDGQVYPRRVGIKIRQKASGDRELVGVRVYRGLPSSKLDPKGYGAADRQVALWKQQALVQPVTRPLNYRDPSAPREKGIDVRIAIDIVMMIERGECDVAALFSDDTDLLPALEAIIDRKGPSACEVVTWEPNTGAQATPLRVRGGGHLIHRLSYNDYTHIRDTTDYTARRRRR